MLFPSPMSAPPSELILSYISHDYPSVYAFATSYTSILFSLYRGEFLNLTAQYIASVVSN